MKPVLQLTHGDTAKKNQNSAEHPGLPDSEVPVPQAGRSSAPAMRLRDVTNHFPFPGVAIRYILQCHQELLSL